MNKWTVQIKEFINLITSGIFTYYQSEVYDLHFGKHRVNFQMH